MRVSYLLMLSVVMTATPSWADNSQPDEAFLLFIANLESVDQHWVGPLDMLDDRNKKNASVAEPTHEKTPSGNNTLKNNQQEIDND